MQYLIFIRFFYYNICTLRYLNIIYTMNYFSSIFENPLDIFLIQNVDVFLDYLFSLKSLT